MMGSSSSILLQKIRLGLQRGLAGGVARGIGANAMFLVCTSALQVASVPIFIHSVGVAAYGEWLIITAVPAYLSLSDLGFAAAAATTSTYALVENRFQKAREILSSAWLSVTVLSTLLSVVIVAASNGLMSEASFPHLGGDAHEILWLQLAWAGLWMQIGYFEAAFRSADQYPVGIYCLMVTRVVEFATTVAALFMYSSLLYLATSLLVVRLVCAVAIYAYARRRLAWFKLSVAAATVSTSKSLLLPSLSYSGFTFGWALSGQGMVLAVGAALGSEAVVAYTTVRTMANSLQQVMSVATGGSLANLTKAAAQGAVERARAIQRSVFYLSLAPALVGGTIIATMGNTILHFWTGGRVQVEWVFIALMVATTVADIPWQVTVNMLRARNQHQWVGLAFFAGCVLALCITLATVRILGLIAPPLALFVIDIVVVPVAVWSSRRSKTWETRDPGYL